ncbi:MAG: endonuclease/exonuclease/phosphatase family protein [Pseudodonghicola sp.]|nr:endonuclease/exonuclease/phosphatase family protein [Pseudodonghicola sp.]
MSDSTALRLASYNIQKCVGLDLRRKPRRILQVLARLRAQVVVLQEADKRLPPRPAALPHFVLEEAGWDVADLGGAGSLGWHGNAVIWRKGVVSLRDMGQIDLPGLEPRGAVWVEFDSPLGPLRVVGLHLGLVGQSRRMQVLHLAQECALLPPMPMIWAGDFNEWSGKSMLEKLAPRMQFLPRRASFPALRPLGALDRIALSAGLAARGHGVHLEQPAHIASDHLPIWADIVAQGR